MKKRLLSVFLCLCLLVPAMGLSFGQSASAETGYVIADLGYSISGAKTVLTNKQLFIEGLKLDEPIDLTRYGFPTSGKIGAGKLGIQFDLSIAGDDGLVNMIVDGASGQIELCSGGDCDKGELDISSARLKFVKNQWTRMVIDLSEFNFMKADSDPFVPSHFDYFRVYMISFPDNLIGQSCVIKIINVRLVDLTKPAPSVEEDPIGDGSFNADPPVFKQVEFGETFRDDIVVAGYNLGEYMASHNIKDVKDYGVVIQSLLDGMAFHGGGTVFIPAGEYDCYTPLNIPTGVTLCGEWRNPNEYPEIKGTVLKVHCGENQLNDPAFMTLTTNSKVQNLAFWYPEQGFKQVKIYPATIETTEFTCLENITLVNSYFGIDQTYGMNSPNEINIYGTPLSSGIDVDMVWDIMRLENLNFAPDYWINSGLAGAPASKEDADVLRELLYYNSTAVTIRRIDWSYLANITVKGYATGLAMAKSMGTSNTQYPYGQCSNLTFDGCGTAIYSLGGREVITDSTVVNCDTGVWMTSGSLRLIDSDVSANRYAVNNTGDGMTLLLSSRIHSGEVYCESGYFGASNSTFENEAPHVALDSAARGTYLVGNRDGSGKPITVDNPYLIPLSYDNAPFELDEIGSIGENVVTAADKKPASNVAYVFEDVAAKVGAAADKTGAKDMTEALNKSLAYVAQQGGGVLFLPSGFYRIDGTVTIPTGVELKGSCDFARIPFMTGSILQIYGGKGDPDAASAIVMKEGSGLRAVVIDYPEQTVDDLTLVKFPYAIQGQGKDIWLFNVAFHNAWNGIDLMTYRCDNHYVSGACGVCINNFLKVGGGAENGVIRNYQLNYIGFLYGYNPSTYGGWKNYPHTLAQAEAATPLLEKYMQENTVISEVGDVENEIFYNCFNYAGDMGLLFRAEETGSANATIYGHGIDYGTVSVNIEQAERLKFVNLQVTSFNSIGDQLTKDMNCVRLGEDCTATVDIISMDEWAEPNRSILEVQNGTLNVRGLFLGSSLALGTVVSEKGTLNLYDTYCTRSATTPLADENLQNVHMNGGYFCADLVDSDQFGDFKNIVNYVTRWDVPTNAQLDPNTTMIFTEAFTEYDTVPVAKRTVWFDDDEGGLVTTRNNVVNINLTSAAATAGICTPNFKMDGGRKDAKYHFETRMKINSMRNTDMSQAMLSVYSNDDDLAYLAFVTKNNEVTVGGEVIGTLEAGEWYRLAAEFDFCDADNKTYQIVLMDDDGNVVATSKEIPLGEYFQGASAYVNRVWLGAMADKDVSPTTVTAMTVDYMFAACKTGGAAGDVNGDGKVDSTDARLILQYYAKKIGESALNLAVADVNGDDKVDSTDARLILQFYAKKISGF